MQDAGEGHTEDARGTEEGESVTFDEAYDEIAINCFRRFGFTSLDQVNRLTLPEYRLMMKAQELKEFDEAFRAHRLAFLCVAASGKKKSGKPMYKKLKDFFDYDKELEKLKRRGKADARMDRMRNYLRGNK